MRTIGPPVAVDPVVERELCDVEAAIGLVGAGVASRVLVAGLAHARVTVLGTQAAAAADGIVVELAPAVGCAAGVLVRRRPQPDGDARRISAPAGTARRR